MIFTENLKKSFYKGNNRIEVLKGVNMHVNQGKISFVLGPSGCGKSTLLYVLGSLLNFDEGNVVVDDFSYNQNLSKNQPAKLRATVIGFVFQSFNLIPNLNLLENILVPFVPDGIKDENVDFARNIIAEFNLDDRINHLPGELSGGEQQRAAICRAIVRKPKILFADEPTGDLDYNAGLEFYEFLRKAKAKYNLTCLIATHDYRYIQKGDKVFILNDGRVYEKKDFEDIERSFSQSNS